MVYALQSLGGLVLFFAFIYIIVHLVQKKIFKREKVLNKRVFYSTVISGFVLSAFGMGLEQSDENAVKVTELTEENTELNSELESIHADHEQALTELKEQHTSDGCRAGKQA